MKTYTIVSDPGVDDIIALLLLLKLSPVQEHTLISTFGNAPEKFTAQNVKEFMSLIAPHWFYASGARNPLKPLEYPWPDYFHGPDGMCGIHPNVTMVDIKLGTESSTVQNLISLGPMTEVCNMLQQDKVKSTTVMGGAIHVPGNETAYAETNIAFDPEAAEYVFANCEDIEVNVVPLDVTKQVFWTKNNVVQISEDGAYKVWIKKILLAWFENYGGKQESVFHLHDPLAIYSMYFPDSLEWITSGIEVLIDGVERGRTVLNNKNPPCKIVSGVHSPSHIAQRIFEIIFLI